VSISNDQLSQLGVPNERTGELAVKAAWARALRAQREGKYREATRLLEDFTLQFPDHAPTPALLARLSSLERGPLPDSEVAEPMPPAASRIEASAFREIDCGRSFFSRGKFDGKLFSDEVLTKTRHYPGLFRAARVVQKAIHRLEWNGRMRGEHRSLTPEAASFDLADWSFSNPAGQTLYLNEACLHHGVIAGQFHDEKRHQQNIVKMGPAGSGKFRAAELMAAFRRDFPSSRLQPKSLLIGLKSRKAWLESLDHGGLQEPVLRAEGLRVHRLARQEYATLKHGFPKTREARQAVTLARQIEQVATPMYPKKKPVGVSRRSRFMPAMRR
jgi:hypothetical protein